LSQLAGLTVSSTKSEEIGSFILHIENGADYRYKFEFREQLFRHIKMAYFQEMGANLRIFSVPGDLKKFCTMKKDIEKGFCNILPPEKYRMLDEDFYDQDGNLIAERIEASLKKTYDIYQTI